MARVGTSRLHQRPYEPHEDEVVRAHWPTGGWQACKPMLQGRSEDSIDGRAYYLGLRRLTGKVHLTDRERAILQKWYGSIGPIGCSLLIAHKTPHAIKCAALRLGLRFRGRRLSKHRPVPQMRVAA